MRRNLAALGVSVAVVVAVLAFRAVLADSPRDRLREQSDGAYEGYWKLLRGGPYIFGLQGPGRLSLDGEPLRLADPRHTGVRTARIVMAPGVYAVRLQAPARTRLVWHPPGRRGPPEYVPAAALGADQASVGPARSLLDGVCAIVILVALLGLLGYWSRGALARADRRVLLAMVAVLVVAWAVRMFDLSGAGQTWDEDVNWSAGRNYVTNLLSLDFAQRSWIWNFEHPPWTKYLVGIGAQFSDGYGPARAVAALALALACALLVPIGRRLYDLRIGLLAGGVAAFTPHLIAHGKVVGHEATAVLWWTVAVWLCLRAYDELDPRDRWQLPRRFAVIGIVLGLAVFSRFASGLLAPLIGALLLLSAPARLRLKVALVGLAIIPAVALLFGLVTWPRLWSTPLANLSEAWSVLSKAHGTEPYLGRVVANDKTPWHYFLVYFYATAPLAWLAGVAAFVVRTVAAHRKAGLTVALWLLVPLAIIVSPVRQDGVRYILPALLAGSLAVAAGIWWAAERLHRRAPVAVAVALMLYLGVTALRVHPYYLDYYGEQVGGPAGVARNKAFELGWWGEGIDRAMAYLNAHAAPNARVDKRRLVPSHVTWMRADLWGPAVTNGPFPSPQADWVLVNELHIKPFAPPAELELAFQVEVQGAPLVRVYRRK